VSATLPDSPAGVPTLFKSEIQDESLEYADSDIASNSGGVLTVIGETDVGEDDLRDPPNGREFVKLEVDPGAGQSGPFPVELGVRVTGKVIAAAKTPDGSGSTPLSGGASGDGRTSDLVLAIGGVAGILLGFLAGRAAAGLGRRRPA
jgi:hypothetical protein